jgi:hypothetical protein
LKPKCQERLGTAEGQYKESWMQTRHGRQPRMHLLKEQGWQVWLVERAELEKQE